MISNEEMYDFASQIAGITDADLQQYKCGGKAKKMAEGKKVTKKSAYDENDNDESIPDFLKSSQLAADRVKKEQEERERLERQKVALQRMAPPKKTGYNAPTIEEIRGWAKPKKNNKLKFEEGGKPLNTTPKLGLSKKKTFDPKKLGTPKANGPRIAVNRID